MPIIKMTRANKIFIITAMVVVLLLVVLILIRKNVKPKPVVTPTPTPSRYVTPFITSRVTPSMIPTAETITLKGVAMKNFYKDAVQVNAKGDALLVSTSQYQLVYQQEGERFMISVNDSPYEKVQEEAEQTLLTHLGITADDACWLGVFVSSPYFANPDEAGKVYNPRFCEHLDEP